MLIFAVSGFAVKFVQFSVKMFDFSANLPELQLIFNNFLAVNKQAFE